MKQFKKFLCNIKPNHIDIYRFKSIVNCTSKKISYWEGYCINFKNKKA